MEKVESTTDDLRRMLAAEPDGGELGAMVAATGHTSADCILFLGELAARGWRLVHT